MIRLFGFCLGAWASVLWAQDGGLPPALVRAEVAKVTQMSAQIQVPGTVVSRNDARVAAEVEGVLIAVADVGTQVAQGEVLARIEDTMLKLRESELKAQVAREDAGLAFLGRELMRLEKLAEQNNAARTQLDQTRSDREVAFNDLAVAKVRLAQVQDQLDRTTLRAPFGGTVVARLQQAGERVSPGDAVVRLLDPRHLEVIARAPLEYMPFIAPGDRLSIELGRQSLSGLLRTLVAVGNENTHVFEARIDLTEAAIPVGQTVRVNLPAAPAREVLAVPRDALVLRPEGISIFVIEADMKARQVPVQTGLGAGAWIEVQGELEAGERVIIRGNERLRPGQTVMLQPETTAAAAIGGTL